MLVKGATGVKFIAYCLFVAQPLSGLILTCQLDNKLQWNFNQNKKKTFFIHENAVENVVCEMAAILSRGHRVKTMIVIGQYPTDASFLWIKAVD